LTTKRTTGPKNQAGQFSRPLNGKDGAHTTEGYQSERDHEMAKYEAVSPTGAPTEMKVEQHENPGAVLFRVTQRYENGKSGQHSIVLTKDKVKQLITDLVSML
jgi:hypothetical protein